MPTSGLDRARRQFVDDELLRVPLLAEQVFEAAFEALRKGTGTAAPQERFAGAELLRSAEAHRPAMVTRFVASVSEQLRAELGIDLERAAPAPAVTAPQRPTLSLLDETEVAADVEISHAIEGIKSLAEHELRELATFTAALAGDMDMGRDHNPFRAETYARAMWEAAQTLRVPRIQQVRMMRAASRPLAQLLRQTYAGACARLEAAGVEPAAHRTVILAPGARTTRPSDSWLGQGPNLVQMRDTMPAPLHDPSFSASAETPLDKVLNDADRMLRGLPSDAPQTERTRLISSQRSRIVRHADKVVDQQLIELLSRLFDAIFADRRLARDVQFTLTRVQAAVIRLALRDPGVLDDYAHPVWRFMDHLAHQASLQPQDSTPRAEGLRLAEGLIDTLATDNEPAAIRYAWARERLVALDRSRLERRQARVAPDIAVLQALEDRLAGRTEPLPTGTGPLEESQLETVPAELMDDLAVPPSDASSTSQWLDSLRPGDWVRLFRDGHWLRAQLLWQGRRRDVWLFGEGSGDATCALRQAALARLYKEGLASTVKPRSLVRSAAVELMRAAKARDTRQ